MLADVIDLQPLPTPEAARTAPFISYALLDDLLAAADDAAASTSVARLENLIISEVRQGTASSKIVLVGFSQGAALSLMTALTTLHELGGVASLSGWIPQPSRQVNRHLLTPQVHETCSMISLTR